MDSHFFSNGKLPCLTDSLIIDVTFGAGGFAFECGEDCGANK